MISSTTTTSSDDNNNNVSLSVVQTVKKWIRNSWPFATAGKIDERRPEDDAARQEGEVLYIHEDECASVDDTTVIDGDRRYDEKCGDDNDESGGAAFEDYGSKEASSASLSNGQHDNDDDNKAGSRVMDIVMASPKKYFLRSSRRRRSCRFQLDDDKIDVVARSSNDDERVMASGQFGGLNDNDGVDSKVSSTTINHDDRSKQDYDDNDKQIDEVAAPTLPQDTTTTNHSCSWTQQEITSLRQAYQQSNPTSPTLWQDISTAMKCTRSAGECQRKWFSLVATPKKRVGRRKNGRVVNDVKKKKYGVEEDESEEEDDLFDSTPLKCAVQEIENDLLFHQRRRTTAAAAVAAVAKQQEEVLEQDNNDTTFQSPNKIMTKMIKSPLSKRPRMFSPKNRNSNNNNNGGMKNDGILSPLINRRKGYNTYVNNLRREIGRAQKARKRGDDDDKMSGDGNIGSCGNNSSRGGRGKGGGSTANKSSTTIRRKEGKGKSQLSAELVDGSFVLNIPQEDSDDENGSDVDLFEEVFRMEDEENEFRCD